MMLSMVCWRIGLVGRLGVLSLLSIIAVGVRAETYMAAFDSAQWRVERSPLACRLMQVVPRFGEAVFETVGGERQRFVLRTKKNLLIAGSSPLTAVAPIWNPSRKTLALGSVDVAAGPEPLQLSGEQATQLLDSLSAGLVPMFTRPLQNDAQQTARVALSPVNFRVAYRQYHECIGGLLPVTFDDIKNTIIEFPYEQSELSAATQKKIDFLLRYIALDHSITHFEIRSVSSDKLRWLDNLELAKQRMQQICEYLMSRGIDAKAIESSYRGERASSDKHRFVSIRLKRSSATN